MDVFGLAELEDHVAAGRIGRSGDPVRVRREVAEKGRLRDDGKEKEGDCGALHGGVF